MRERANRYGRRGGGNNCGHERGRFVRASWKPGLPTVVRMACERTARATLPLLLGRARRSELTETARAVLPVMLARMDIVSGRVGKPDRNNPRRFVGLSIDHDLAPLSGISESRIERFIGTLEDWDWLHWHAAPVGRRKAKRGYLRCAAQPIERLPSGERRGRAAIRVFTEELFRFFPGLWVALCEERAKRARAAAAEASGRRRAVVALVGQVANAHTLTDPRERPPP
jgi:hypothetical protein